MYAYFSTNKYAPPGIQALSNGQGVYEEWGTFLEASTAKVA